MFHLIKAMNSTSSDLDLVYQQLRLANFLVSKALAVSEVSQIAKIEVRLREYISKKWNIRQKEAAKKASSLASKGKKANLISNEIKKIMSLWPKDIEKTFLEEFDSIYRLARIAGWKKATGQTKGSLQYDAPDKLDFEVKKAKKDDLRFRLLPSFDLADEKTLEALEDHQLFWINNHYDQNVSDTIAIRTKDVMEEFGQNNTLAAAKMLEEINGALSFISIPQGFAGSSMQYFDGLVANAATVARAHGQMRSFGDIGITYYVINNPVDERTCPRCSHLDGKEFSVQDGYNQMEQELKASNPDEVKSVHPWLSYGQIKEISPKAGFIEGKAGRRDSANLAKNGQALPPYHFKCRCTVDVSTESFSYDNLEPMEAISF